MLFELSDQVRQNIMVFLARTDIKGKEWRAMADIEVALNNPVKAEQNARPKPKLPPAPPPAPENETTNKGKKPKP